MQNAERKMLKTKRRVQGKEWKREERRWKMDGETPRVGVRKRRGEWAARFTGESKSV
jgi:hypothetical protein